MNSEFPFAPDLEARADVLLDFMAPIRAVLGTESFGPVVEGYVRLGVLVWNACIGGDEGLRALGDARRTVAALDSGETLRLFDSLVQRRQRFFGSHHWQIADFVVVENHETRTIDVRYGFARDG